MKVTNDSNPFAYVPPMLTVVEVMVEHGFEGSDDGGGTQLPSWEII